MIGAVGLILPLVMIVGAIAGIGAIARRNDSEPEGGLVRRLVVAVLAFGMTVVVASGLFQVLDAAFSSFGTRVRGSDSVAIGLALLIVGSPAGFFLWRYLLRSLEGPDGRSVVWLLHQGVASLTFAIGTVVAAGNALRFDSGWEGSAAFAVAWLTAWLFYEWVGRRHAAPLLPGLPHAAGIAVGLVSAAIGSVGVLAAVFDSVGLAEAIRPSGYGAFTDSLPWAVVGLVVWIWQRRGMDPASPAIGAVDVVFGVGGGALLGLGGIGGVLFLLFDSIGSSLELGDLPGSIAMAVVGIAVWRFHDGLVGVPPRRSQATHLISGMSLIALAASVGVLVNALLGQFTSDFISADSSIVAGGFAALTVSAPTWWWTWRPDRQPDDAAGTNLRRIYLTLLAGVGAVAATISLVVVVFQVIQGILDGAGFAEMVERSRGAIGVLVGTGLVTWYHLRLWRAGRPEAEHVPMALERVTFVGPERVAEALRHDLDVRVTDWRSGGTGRLVDEDELADHLRGLGTDHALVVAEDGGYRVTRIGAVLQEPQTAEPQS